MSVVTSPAALSSRHASKRYGRTEALVDLSFEVPTGSITALIGPNGAGKSTLLRSWVGLEPLNGGKVTVCGIDPWVDRAAAIVNVGFIPQSAAIYPDLSIADHIELAAHFRPDFDRKMATGRLADLAIPMARRGSALSGGQQAQVALALALGTRAAVLLLDEPLASLDPLARREFLHVMRQEAKGSGRTVLLSSHVVSDIEQVCDRLIVLGGGHLLFDGSVEDAIEGHEINVGSATGSAVVGTFVDIDADAQLTLLRGTGSRRPTLEELVLGYLAAGRDLQGLRSEGSR